MTRIEDVPFCEIVSAYESGSTFADLGKRFDVPARTIHSWFEKAYIPRRNRGVPLGYCFSDERNRKLSVSLRGKKRSEEHCKRISDAKKCDYNGLNGYGHTKKHNRGYVTTYCPCHPIAHSDGYVMLHTVLMERHIGRYLENDEVVHHINHDRADNRIENLMLMKKKDHMSMHMRERHEQRRKEKCNELSLQAI